MPISKKQREILAFPYTSYDAIICDGAIRSGKTSFMVISFVDWAMSNFDNQRFGLCGKTVDSCTKNLVMPYISTNYANEKYRIRWKQAEKQLIINRDGKENVFEIFGGKDESSFQLIQGRTLAGVLLDEVALMPKSFVEQACARCSVDGSKLWFNCNPSSPSHWFYQDWIKEAKQKNALHLHFLLEDNPSLTEKIVDRYKSLYKGVFYNRYIRGEWCVAEGLVYDFGEDNIVDEVPENGEYYVSIDYGTLNPFSAGLWCLIGGTAYRIKEYYYSGRKTNVQHTDEQYCDAVEELTKGYNIKQVIVDPSAASFITALKKRGFHVRQANNDVIDGIRRTAVFLQEGKLKIKRCCVNSIAEFGLYRWDEKANEDKVIKENDHCMDEIRYLCNTVLKFKQGKEYRPLFG